MTDRKIFGLLIRLFGLYVGLYYGVLNLFSGAGILVNPKMTQLQSAPYFVMGVLAVVFGVLLVKADWLVNFAYGYEPGDRSQSVPAHPE